MTSTVRAKLHRPDRRSPIEVTRARRRRVWRRRLREWHERAASITTAGGARGIVDQAARLAARVGGDGVYVVSSHRPGDTLDSGAPSDHAQNGATRAARDIAVRGIDALAGPPSPKLDKAVVALGRAFGVDFRDGTQPIVRNIVWEGYRVQIIWRTPEYGGHMGHIHIGVKRL
jgi:hypothetical protein